MSGTNVIYENNQGMKYESESERLWKTSRLVSVSVLATFLREYPLTYLTKEERRIFLSFQDYVVHLEGKLFEEAGVGR